MKIDLLNHEAWAKLNLSAKRLSGRSGRVSVWPGSLPALNEILGHLTAQFPHRKRIHLLRHMSPVLDQLGPALAKRGLRVDGLPWEGRGHDPASVLASIDKESLALILAEDDPLLGSLHGCENLIQSLASQKIYILQLSHSAHLSHGKKSPPLPYEIRVLGLGSNLALIEAGDRATLPAQLGADLYNWSGLTESDLALHIEPPVSAQSAIEALESSHVAGSEPVLQASFRLYDRAVLAWRNLDGLAMIEMLAQIRRHPLQPAGLDPYLETASRSRWGGLRSMDWLHSFGMSDEQIRGLVIISAAWMDDKIRGQIEQAAKEIHSLQNTEVSL